jgi:hypothetical protein
MNNVWPLFLKKFITMLLHRFYGEMTRKNKRQSNIKILYSTTIDLCVSVFPWASFRARKAGIKEGVEKVPLFGGQSP